MHGSHCSSESIDEIWMKCLVQGHNTLTQLRIEPHCRMIESIALYQATYSTTFFTYHAFVT